MSDGEKKAIEILTDYKDGLLNRKPFTYSFIDMQWAIGAILDLYNKEKAENKELKEDNKNLRDTNKQLYELCQRQAMQLFIENDYIKKSKVEEEIKKAINKEIDTSKAMFEGDFTNGYIFALQSLLGKE